MTSSEQPPQSYLLEVTFIAGLDLLEVLRGKKIKLIHTISSLEVYGSLWKLFRLRSNCGIKCGNLTFKFMLFLIHTRIYGHLWWPFFLPFGYGKLLELVSNCNSLNNSEGMTIFGRNDTNPEGMTVIRKE